MNKQLLSAALTLAALSSPQHASAALDDIVWVPQVGIQLKQLEFKQDFTFAPGVGDGGSYDADLPSAALSLTAIHNRFYASVKYEGSFGDTSAHSDVTFTNAETKAEREDFSFTLGYKVWNNLNLFVGYMEGETILKPNPTCNTTSTGPNLLDASCVITAGGVVVDDAVPNFALIQSIRGGAAYEQRYKEDGFYLGAGYGWMIAETGTLSLSVAYADLDTVYKDNFQHAGDNGSGKFSGDADGFSFGLNWSAPLTERVGYYLDVRTQQYKMDSKASSGYWEGVRVKTEENITAFTAGIQWYL